MEKIWRLIIDEAREPNANMAIDEAIMLRIIGGSMPTLRIYRWLYPCISIGKFQDPLTLTLSPSPQWGEGRVRGIIFRLSAALPGEVWYTTMNSVLLIL